MKKLNLAVFLLSINISSLAIADEIPVEDFSTSASAANYQQSAPLEQQVARLNQQMQNLTQMNLPAKIDALQQQVQQLRGALDTAQHTIEILQNGQPQKQSGNLVSVAGNSELQEYQSAFNLLRDKNYPDAVTKMQDYLTDYPNGKYAANAHYWLGEVYYLEAKLPEAAKEFKTITDNYPDSEKEPDSLLKLAMIYDTQGRHQAAHQLFQKIRTKYPDSAAARLMGHKQKVALN